MKKPRNNRPKGITNQAKSLPKSTNITRAKGPKRLGWFRFGKGGDGEENNDWMQKYLDKLMRKFGRG